MEGGKVERYVSGAEGKILLQVGSGTLLWGKDGAAVVTGENGNRWD